MVEICPALSEKYSIERQLGQGGGGCVYLAQDNALGRYVVLKHHKALAPGDQRQVERLLQEARTVANLRHPNVAIVFVTESYPESGDYSVVMEYAEGGTLADLIKAKGRISLEKALDIGIQVCTALEYVHRNGIIHGDIKPSNILFFHGDDQQLVAKIADFGLSRVQVGDRRIESQEGAYWGTLEYAAPELLRGDRVPDGRADLYSLGVVLYEMLTGRPPFPLSGDLATVIAGHLHGDVAPPQELRPAVFSELNELVLTALAKSPTDRFQDAEAMLTALQRARDLWAHYHEQAERLYEHGLDLEREQDWPGAVEAFREACNLNPELADVAQRLKNTRLGLELETAWREVEALLACKAWADALEKLGRIGTLDSEYRAEKVAQRAQYARLQLELASLYGDARAAEGAGRRREAIRLYVRILAQDDGYEDVAQRLARLRTDEDLEDLWTQGERLVRQERWDEAAEVYERIIGTRPDYPGAAQQLVRARRQCELARLYTQAQMELEKVDWAGALAVLQDITTIEPGYKDAAVQLANASRQLRLGQLREDIGRATEEHQWSKAATLLEDLLRFEPTNAEVQQQLAQVRQWRDLDDAYRQGRADYEAGRWEGAIARLESALKIASAAGLDLYNYRDIEPLLNRAQTQSKLDAMREQGRQYEAAEDWGSLVQVLDQMLGLAPGNQEVLAWREAALQQMRLGNLYGQASSRMEQKDWAGAKRLLDQIAAVDAGFKDVRELRARAILGQGVAFTRRLVLPLAIVLGAGLLVLFVPQLFTGAQRQPGLADLAIVSGIVGTVVGVCVLVVGVVGLLIPVQGLYGLLGRHKRLRASVIVVVSLVLVLSLVLAAGALVSGRVALRVSAPEPPLLCNGDLEHGFACWRHGGKLRQNVECDAGRCYAVLGDPRYRCDGGVPLGDAWMRQSFQVPDTPGPTLSLWYRVRSYDLDNLDYFQVSINGDPVGRFGNPDWAESSCSGEAWDSGWQSVQFDLSAHRGERVELLLQNVNGTYEWWNTWTYVDDVQVR